MNLNILKEQLTPVPNPYAPSPTHFPLPSTCRASQEWGEKQHRWAGSSSRSSLRTKVNPWAAHRGRVLGNNWAASGIPCRDVQSWIELESEEKWIQYWDRQKRTVKFNNIGQYWEKFYNIGKIDKPGENSTVFGKWGKFCSRPIGKMGKNPLIYRAWKVQWMSNMIVFIVSPFQKGEHVGWKNTRKLP